MADNFKPNTWYWFWSPRGEQYVPGETELHEGTTAPNQSYCSFFKTNEHGEIVRMTLIGNEFPIHWPKGS